MRSFLNQSERAILALWLCLLLHLPPFVLSRSRDGVAASTTAASPVAAPQSLRVHQADQTFTRIAAGKLKESLSHHRASVYHTPKVHPHREFLRRTFSPKRESRRGLQTGSLGYILRVGLAGGIAGATGTIALFPVDTAKTMRQANPSLYANVPKALTSLIVDAKGRWHIGRAYAGVIPATLGAIPSSALYFGAYEAVKPWIRKSQWVDGSKVSGRFLVHALSAAAGNVLSSAVFVPKEMIKQQMQYRGRREIGRVVKEVIRQYGVRGLFKGYQATLMRNIPSAVLRFTVYEELKHFFVLDNPKEKRKGGFNWKLFVAGATAGAISSGLMTPVDVIKTRMATGTFSGDMLHCIQYVVRENGISGLYMGAGTRIVWSTVFAAIGFGMLETAKGWLGVSDVVDKTASSDNETTVKEFNIFSHHQRLLEHALSDRCD